MGSPAGKRLSDWLLDVNVWLATCSDRHELHHAAANWLAAVLEPVYFCCVTQMSLLRLLTNPKVMGEDLLSPEEAIDVYRELLADQRVHYADEPAHVENFWLSMMTGLWRRGASGLMPGWQHFPALTGRGCFF